MQKYVEAVFEATLSCLVPDSYVRVSAGCQKVPFTSYRSPPPPSFHAYVRPRLWLDSPARAKVVQKALAIPLSAQSRATRVVHRMRDDILFISFPLALILIACVKSL